VDASLQCVWPEIAARADTEALRELAEVHAVPHGHRLEPNARRASPRLLRRVSNWMVSRIPCVDRLLRCLN
jgi:hypothetical protein